MMHKRRCRQTFSISRNPNQTYCSKTLCQTFRRQQWKKKHSADPDYQANQRAAQQAWLKRRPDYYQDYRAVIQIMLSPTVSSSRREITATVRHPPETLAKQV